MGMQDLVCMNTSTAHSGCEKSIKEKKHRHEEDQELNEIGGASGPCSCACASQSTSLRAPQRGALIHRRCALEFSPGKICLAFRRGMVQRLCLRALFNLSVSLVCQSVSILRLSLFPSIAAQSAFPV